MNQKHEPSKSWLDKNWGLVALGLLLVIAVEVLIYYAIPTPVR